MFLFSARKKDEKLGSLFYDAAVQFLLKGKYADCFQYLDNASQLHPESLPVRKLQSLLRLCCNDFTGSLTEIESGFRISGNDAWLHCLKGACFIAVNKSAEAAVLFERAALINPDQKQLIKDIENDWQGYVSRTNLWTKFVKKSWTSGLFSAFSTQWLGGGWPLGAPPPATDYGMVEERMQALHWPHFESVENTSYKELAKIIREIGWHVAGQGQDTILDEAFQYLNLAIELDRTNDHIYNDRALLHHIKSRHDLAWKDVEEGLLAVPHSALLRLQKGYCLIFFGKFDDAEILFREAVAVDPTLKECVDSGRRLALKQIGRLDLLFGLTGTSMHTITDRPDEDYKNCNLFDGDCVIRSRRAKLA